LLVVLTAPGRSRFSRQREREAEERKIFVIKSHFLMEPLANSHPTSAQTKRKKISEQGEEDGRAVRRGMDCSIAEQVSEARRRVRKIDTKESLSGLEGRAAAVVASG
jgi:hypothetical protein